MAASGVGLNVHEVFFMGGFAERLREGWQDKVGDAVNRLISNVTDARDGTQQFARGLPPKAPPPPAFESRTLLELWSKDWGRLPLVHERLMTAIGKLARREACGPVAVHHMEGLCNLLTEVAEPYDALQLVGVIRQCPTTDGALKVFGGRRILETLEGLLETFGGAVGEECLDAVEGLPQIKYLFWTEDGWVANWGLADTSRLRAIVASVRRGLVST